MTGRDVSILCRKCGKRVDPVTAPIHPACEWTDEQLATLARWRAEDRLAAAAKRGAVVREAVARGNPDAIDGAVAIIERTARRLAEFSANDCRAELDAAGVAQPARGPAFGIAARRRLIERTDRYEPSAAASTNGHPIAIYRSLILEHV